jgi:hypothetical protein
MIALILAATVAAQTPTANGIIIKQYLREPMHVYDDKGAYVGQINQNTLPKVASLSVIGVDNARVLVRQPDGKQIELRVSELLIDGLVSTCTTLASANRPADQHRAAGDVGASSGLSTQSLPCVK